MKNTRKLQFAAELMEEVQEDTTTERVEKELQAMRSTMDELRHLCLIERVNEVSDGMKESAD